MREYSFDVSDVELLVHRDPRFLGHTISMRIGDKLCEVAQDLADKALASRLAKIAIRQRPKARVWARHHMRKVARA